MTADTLVMRRVYAYPFWAIEASDKRWEWDVARAVFDPETVNGHKAARFAKQLAQAHVWRSCFQP